MKKYILLSLCLSCLAGCSAFKPTPAVNGHAVPESKMTKGQWVESDPNRIANLEIRDNLATLYQLMDKLYKRNPSQWKRSSAASMALAETRVKDAVETRQPLPGIDGKRDIAAMRLALDPDYQGDRVGTLIYGMADMLVTAHGGKTRLYLIDGVDAQRVYNAARNVEIAMWMLAERKGAKGEPLLVSNELSEQGRNLSFERLFGTVIGRTDLVAEFAAEKYRRSAINYVQSFLGGQFLQFLPVQSLSGAAAAAQ